MTLRYIFLLGCFLLIPVFSNAQTAAYITTDKAPVFDHPSTVAKTQFRVRKGLTILLTSTNVIAGFYPVTVVGVEGWISREDVSFTPLDEATSMEDPSKDGWKLTDFALKESVLSLIFYHPDKISRTGPSVRFWIKFTNTENMHYSLSQSEINCKKNEIRKIYEIVYVDGVGKTTLDDPYALMHTIVPDSQGEEMHTLMCKTLKTKP